MARLLALPRVEIDARAQARAVETQTELASVGHHRIPPADLVIAVLAEREGLGVLHYDDHYDRLAEMTDLAFDSVWLADPGSL